jgi:purine-binding chemotaxis protein CheW
LPGASPGTEGVINLRGVIVPVLDLRKRFGLPAKALDVADHFIVVRAKERLIALHVDRALELARLEAGALTEVETLGPQGEGSARVAKQGTGMILLHQVQDLLALVDPEVLAGPTAADALPIQREVIPS